MGADDSVVVLRSNDGRTFAIPLKRALKSQYLIDAYTEFKKGMASFDTDGGVIIDVGLANGTILEYIANLLQKNTPRVPQGVAYDMAFDFLYLFGLDCKLLKRALLHFPGQSMAYAYLTDSENKLIYRRDWLQYELPAWEWGIMASVVQLIRAYPNSAKHGFMKQQFQRVPGYDYFLKLGNDSLSDPAAVNNEVIREAAGNGHAEVVRTLLNTPNRGIDPADDDNDAIRWAARNGHAKVVRLLLDTPNRGIDPAAVNNQAIQWAATNGHAEVVRMLLDTPNRGIDPAIDVNYAIRWAARNGHAKVMRLLLDTPNRGIDPAADVNYAIRWAAALGRAEVVRLLLDARDAQGNFRVDPAAQDNDVIKWAASEGNVDVVRMLLNTLNRDIDPAAQNNQAIWWAARGGHAEVVRMLLDTPDRGIDPAAQDNVAMRIAAQRGHAEVVRMLLTDQRVRALLSPQELAEYSKY